MKGEIKLEIIRPEDLKSYICNQIFKTPVGIFK